MYERYHREDYEHPVWILVNDFDNPPLNAVNFGPENFNRIEEGIANNRESLGVARWILPVDEFDEETPIDQYPVCVESIMEVTDWNSTAGIVKTYQGEGTVRKQYYITDTEDYRRLSLTNSRPNWQALTDYEIDDERQPTIEEGRYYKVTQAGTSGATEPIWSPSGDVEDGTVIWSYAGNYWGVWQQLQYA